MMPPSTRMASSASAPPSAPTCSTASASCSCCGLTCHHTTTPPSRARASACAARKRSPPPQMPTRVTRRSRPARWQTAGGGVAIHCEGRLGAACTLIAAWMAQLDLFPSPEVAAAADAAAALVAPLDGRQPLRPGRHRLRLRGPGPLESGHRDSGNIAEVRGVAAAAGGGGGKNAQPSRFLRRTAAAAVIWSTRATCSTPPLPLPAGPAPPPQASPTATPRPWPEAPLVVGRIRAFAASNEAGQPPAGRPHQQTQVPL